jgi:hypothetical protein
MRTIQQIAKDIKEDWKKPYFAAQPYLFAMLNLIDINDRFGYDTAKSIISYFLSNSGTYRTPKAKYLKQELRQLLA